MTGEAEARVDVSVWTLPYKLLLVWKLLNFTAAGVDSAIYTAFGVDAALYTAVGVSATFYTAVGAEAPIHP